METISSSFYTASPIFLSSRNPKNSPLFLNMSLFDILEQALKCTSASPCWVRHLDSDETGSPFSNTARYTDKLDALS